MWTNLIVRNVYVFNTTENEAQIDTYLNQKATTYKKIETGTAKQWIQYSFTMSDEEYYEFLNRNNNTRMHSSNDFQKPDFSEIDLSNSSVHFTLDLGVGGSGTIPLLTGNAITNNHNYLGYLDISKSDGIFRATPLIELTQGATVIFTASGKDNSSFFLNNYECDQINTLNLTVINTSLVPQTYRGFLIYHKVNDAR